MKSFWSRLTFSGIIVFALTFFLPPDFYNSPLGRFRWSFDSIFLAESAAESLAFVGIGLAIAYPYLWALITAFFLFSNSPGVWSVRSQFIAHLVGAVPITALGLTLIFLKAEFPLPRVQWIAALTPAAFIIFFLAAAKLVKIRRRFSALVAISLLLFIPLQFVLYHYVLLDGGVGWGYLLGGAAALTALIGNLVVIIRS